MFMLPSCQHNNMAYAVNLYTAVLNRKQKMRLNSTIGYSLRPEISYLLHTLTWAREGIIHHVKVVYLIAD